MLTPGFSSLEYIDHKWLNSTRQTRMKMRANLLKCDEGRLNSIMIKSYSNYFGESCTCLSDKYRKDKKIQPVVIGIKVLPNILG